MITYKTTSIARLTVTVGDSDKESYVTVEGLERVAMDIQPANAELIALTDGVMGQTFRAFTQESNIFIGDRVTVSGTSDVFTVRGIDNWDYGPIPHLELVLFKGDS